MKQSVYPPYALDLGGKTGYHQSITCYAAKKNSLVIGSDGMVYKCTVHFDLPENQVGKLHENGTIELNENFLKWIRPFSEMDVECSNCYNRAACYPMKCPYALIRYGKAYCPPMSGGNFKVFLESIHPEVH